MAVNDGLIKHLQDSLLVITGKEGKISSVTAVGGGSINDTYSFRLGPQRFFLKINSASRFPKMFEAEAKGLELLAGKGLSIPKVIFNGQLDKEQYLVLEFMERNAETPKYFYELGKGLARIHRNSNEQFGLNHSNYIGSLLQENNRSNDWTEFFVCNRLEPLLRMAIDKSELPSNCITRFNSLYKKLDEIIPKESPALLHGDLWSGNKMNTTIGPCVFDPSVYYGHREVDIAMTQLFGGFANDFYTGYNEEFLLEKGWEKRIDIFNLYPLLVHVNLFGGGYVRDVMETVKMF